MSQESPHIFVNGVPLKSIVDKEEKEQRASESESLRQDEIRDRTYHSPIVSGGTPLRNKLNDRLGGAEHARQVQRLTVVLRNHPQGITYDDLIRKSGTVLSKAAVRLICRGKLKAYVWREKIKQGKLKVSFVKPDEAKVGHIYGVTPLRTKVAAPLTPFPLPTRAPATADEIEVAVERTAKKILETLADVQVAFWTKFKEGLK